MGTFDEYMADLTRRTEIGEFSRVNYDTSYLSTLVGTPYENMLLPMLARPMDVATLLKNFPSRTAYRQPKLDGVRMIYTGAIESAVGRFHSRKGKPIATRLTELREMIRDTFGNLPVDGELYVHRDRSDNFREIISQVRTQSEDMEDNGLIEYHVYDLPIAGMPFSERIEMLRDVVARNGVQNRIKVVETEFFSFDGLIGPVQYRDKKNKILKAEDEKAADDAAALILAGDFASRGYEGTMIRAPESMYLFGGLSEKGKNAGHPSGSHGRSKQLLKVKNFFDREVTVVDMQAGEEDGRHFDKMGSLICQFDDGGETKTVKVGSGFTDEDRVRYWNDRSLIVGKEITIKYQELTHDGIPRFPVFVAIRDYE